MDCPAVIACGEASKMLESVEAAFDAVAVRIGFGVMGMMTLRVRLDGMTASAFIAVIVSRKALLS